MSYRSSFSFGLFLLNDVAEEVEQLYLWCDTASGLLHRLFLSRLHHLLVWLLFFRSGRRKRWLFLLDFGRNRNGNLGLLLNEDVLLIQRHVQAFG